MNHNIALMLVGCSPIIFGILQHESLAVFIGIFVVFAGCVFYLRENITKSKNQK